MLKQKTIVTLARGEAIIISPSQFGPMLEIAHWLSVSVLHQGD